MELFIWLVKVLKINNHRYRLDRTKKAER